MIIKRPKYLNELINKQNNSLIKIITGVRRSGKSFLLFNLFKPYLLNIGVPLDHIISIQFDVESNSNLCDREKFWEYLNKSIKDDNKYYLLLDEIQNVKNFEPILIEFSRKPNVDIYVTGSNSKFLSADIDTALNGKNDCIHLYPLTFDEFLQVYDDKEKALDDFFMYGSLPLIATQKSQHDKTRYLQQIYSELYLNDLLVRHRIKNPEELKKIAYILSTSVGSFTNPLNISNTFKSVEKINIQSKTIKKYLNALQASFLINPAIKYDIKGRKVVGASTKYYFEDMGLRNSACLFNNLDKPHILENIVFNELKARDFNVSVGAIKLVESKRNKRKRIEKEIDFIATFGYKKIYIQVSYSLLDPKVRERELSAFKYANNASKKILITMDKTLKYENENGVLIINLFDFLLDKTLLD